MSAEVKILVADDEAVGRQLLEAILLPEGYELIIKEDGRGALDAALNELPDIILLDVMMPDMDGFEVCAKIRNNPATTHTPILLITALDDRDSRIKGIDSGADDYISKPFDRIEILGKIKNKARLIHHHRQTRATYSNPPDANKSSEMLSGLSSRLLHRILDNKVNYNQAIIYRQNTQEFSRHAFVQASGNLTEHFLFCSNNLEPHEAALANASLVYDWTEHILESKRREKNYSCGDFIIEMHDDRFEMLHELKYYLTCICYDNKDGLTTISGLNQVIFVSSGKELNYNLFRMENKKKIQFSQPTQILIPSQSFIENINPEDILEIINNQSFNSGKQEGLEQLGSYFTKSTDQLLVHLSF